MNFDCFNPAVESYSRWLDGQNAVAWEAWRRELKSSDASKHESAIATAVSWDWLTTCDFQLTLADIPGTGGPDFLCKSTDPEFYIEVTNLGIDAVTEKTSLPQEMSGPQGYQDLTEIIKSRVTNKAGQFSDLGKPLLVWVSTLHPTASAICVERGHIRNLLTSRTHIAASYDKQKGELVGPLREGSNFVDALFCSPSPLVGGGMRLHRQHITAVVVAGFGMHPPDARVLGVVHPDPRHPLRPWPLINVPYCAINPWPVEGELRTRWSDESHDADRTEDRKPRIVLPSDADYPDFE